MFLRCFSVGGVQRTKSTTLLTVATILGVFAALSGCASVEATAISLDDGERGELVDCSGFGVSASDCLRKANELCSNDYQVVATTGDSRIASGTAGVLENYDRAMIVRCRES